MSDEDDDDDVRSSYSYEFCTIFAAFTLQINKSWLTWCKLKSGYTKYIR